MISRWQIVSRGFSRASGQDSSSGSSSGSGSSSRSSRSREGFGFLDGSDITYVCMRRDDSPRPIGLEQDSFNAHRNA